MKDNMGIADRIIRAIVALAIGVLFFTGTISGLLAYILLAIGAIFLISSLVGSCPGYQLMGWDTKKKKTKQ